MNDTTALPAALVERILACVNDTIKRMTADNRPPSFTVYHYERDKAIKAGQRVKQVIRAAGISIPVLALFANEEEERFDEILIP